MPITVVTGPTGHMGARLVLALLGRGQRVRTLVHHGWPLYGFPRISHDRVSRELDHQPRPLQDLGGHGALVRARWVAILTTLTHGAPDGVAES